MRAAFVFGFAVICIKLLFDAFMGLIDKEEKAIYAVVSAFFCGMFFAELLLIYRQNRRFQDEFDEHLSACFKA